MSVMTKAAMIIVVHTAVACLLSVTLNYSPSTQNSAKLPAADISHKTHFKQEDQFLNQIK